MPNQIEEEEIYIVPNYRDLGFGSNLYAFNSLEELRLQESELNAENMFEGFGANMIREGVVSGDIYSANFVSGSSGWKLYQSGAVELVDLTASGFIQVGGGAADVNAGAVKIEAGKIIISGSTEFAAGYDPSTKLAIASAGDMAYEDLVELAKLGTTIIQGGYLQTILIDAQYIQAGIITGRTVRTSAGNTRVEMNATDNALYVYKDGYKRIDLNEDRITFIEPTDNAVGAIWGDAGGLCLYASTANNVQIYLEDTAVNTGKLVPGTDQTVDLGSETEFFNDAWIYDLHIGNDIEVLGTVDGVDIQNHKARHYAGGSDAVIRTSQSSGSNLGISAGWAYTHDNNASAHHSSVSDGINITPMSVYLIDGTHKVYGPYTSMIFETSESSNGGITISPGANGLSITKSVIMSDGNYYLWLPGTATDPAVAGGKFWWNSNTGKFRGTDGYGRRDLCYYDERNAASPIPTFVSGLEQLKKIKEPVVLEKEGLSFNTDAFPGKFQIKFRADKETHINLLPVIGMLIKSQKELLEKVEKLENK